MKRNLLLVSAFAAASFILVSCSKEEVKSCLTCETKSGTTTASKTYCESDFNTEKAKDTSMKNMTWDQYKAFIKAFDDMSTELTCSGY